MIFNHISRTAKGTVYYLDSSAYEISAYEIGVMRELVARRQRSHWRAWFRVVQRWWAA